MPVRYTNMYIKRPSETSKDKERIVQNQVAPNLMQVRPQAKASITYVWMLEENCLMLCSLMGLPSVSNLNWNVLLQWPVDIDKQHIKNKNVCELLHCTFVQFKIIINIFLVVNFKFNITSIVFQFILIKMALFLTFLLWVLLCNESLP